jgi:hypothetical protein
MFQILSYIIKYNQKYYNIWSYIIIYYQILWNIIMYCQILSYIIKYYQILSYIIRCYHILPGLQEPPRSSVYNVSISLSGMHFRGGANRAVKQTRHRANHLRTQRNPTLLEPVPCGYGATFHPTMNGKYM